MLPLDNHRCVAFTALTCTHHTYSARYCVHRQIWDEATGRGYTTIESPDGDINDVCVWPGSGLLAIAGDCTRVHAHFVPSLGPAPAWASFLESLTEEMEESAAPAVYDDYRWGTGLSYVQEARVRCCFLT